MSSGINARESENAMCDILISARHVLAMDAFANKSTLALFKAYCGENIHIIDNRYQPCVDEMVEILYDLNSGAEAIRIGYDLLRQGIRVTFISTGAVMAKALVEKASKLSKPDNSPVRAYAYYGNMDGNKLDCVAYTNTVKAGISFEITGHFNIVIAITNIATPVHVEALVQMLYRICHENIRAKLESARPNNLPTAIKEHYEWNNNIISYKVDSSSAIITFIEVEHQKHLSARYFIEKLCSLIASTGFSLQLLKIDESRGVIGNRKKIRNEVRVKALVIKNTDFNAVATSRNLSPEEAEILKFDQERSITDIMNLYCKDMSIEDWNNICNRKFIENFSSPEAWKHFLRLAEKNLKKSVAEDLRKSYSAKHWKVIQELFQILGFTGIDNERILS
ncbi:17739_t:CDS:2, partial [Funneliformis geosporum]